MQSPLLRDVGISILGATAMGFPAFMVRLPLLLGYLAAGVVLGPHLGLGIIKSADSISTLSSIGLILLMFILGLEIDLRKLMQAGKAVFINGVTQFLGCAALAFGFFALLGYGFGAGSFELVYLAVACSLSSTLVVVKLLSDRMELDTLTSRITLGILVIQDLWAIAFLAVQPNLDDLRAIVLLSSIARAALLVGAAMALARWVLPEIFRRIAKAPEMMLVVALAWCFAICGLADALGLSLEMGGLVAGVSIASYPYHADIAVKVSSLRDFFVTLFFVALGLQIPKPTADVVWLACAIIGFAALSRILTVFPVLYLLRYGNRASLIPSLNLSQVSEFSLVLAALGVSYGHLQQSTLSAFILALVATVLISSFLIPNGHEVYRRLNPLLERLGFRDAVAKAAAGGSQTHGETHAPEGSGHGGPAPKVVLLGFFREASSLLENIRQRHSQEALKHLLVVDFNPEAHHRMKDMGIRCKYGDISHKDTLQHLGIEEAELLVCTIPDHVLKGTSNLKMLRALKSIAPKARIIVTAETFDSAKEMYAAGADYVFMPRLVSGHYLADIIESIQSGRGDTLRKAAEAHLQGWKEVLG